jgi:folate-binding protein YgfZ
MEFAKNSVVTLSNRGLITLTGEDRYSLLQSLITGNLDDLTPEKPIYSCLLTAQGKFLHDFFVYSTPESLILECEGAERAQDLHKRLNLYKLRSKVGLELAESVEIYLTPTGGYADPRSLKLWTRNFEKPQNATEAPFEEYEALRISLIVPDGSRDIEVEKDTLLDCNIDRMNGVSFQKGCYVGQEITARMNYRGLVKKHLYAVEWLSQAPPSAFSDLIVNDIFIGQMRSSIGQIGLAQIKDEYIDQLDGAPFKILAR